MNQKPLFLVVTLTALLVIGGAFWMMQKRKVAINQPVVTDPVVEIPYRTGTENPSDTSDWKTYRNEELGIKFKYPKEWTIVPTTTPDVLYVKSKSFEPVPLGTDYKNVLFHSLGEIEIRIDKNQDNLPVRERYLQYDDAFRLYFASSKFKYTEKQVENGTPIIEFETYEDINPSYTFSPLHKVMILKVQNKIMHFDYISQDQSDPQVERILGAVVRSVGEL